MTPINLTAANILKGGCQANVTGESENRICTPIRPRIRHFPKHDTPATLPNLTGVTVGAMTVVGLSLDVKKRWVARCQCGNYEMRKTRKILGGNPHDCCHECKRRQAIRSGVKAKFN